MASPVGHTLSGLALYLLVRRRGEERRFPPLETAAAVLASNAPDLDFIPGLLNGDPSLWHHHLTHSLFFALLVSVCILAAGVLIKKPWEAAGRLSLLVGGLILLHLALDLVTVDTFPPVGMQLFWPFSRDYIIAPWTLLDSVHRGPISPLLLKVWLRIGLKEAALFGTLLAAVIYWRRNDTVKYPKANPS